MGGEHGHFNRVLGLSDLLLISVGAIIGAGIFVITGEAAREVAGPGVIVSYALASLTSVFCALCYAEFAVNHPVAGTAYVYVRETFSELPAFLCAACLVLEYTVASSAVAVGWAGYVAIFLDTLGAELPTALYDAEVGPFTISLFAAMIIAILGYMLVRGIKNSSNVNIVVTGMSIACIVFVLFVGFPSVSSDNYSIDADDIPEEYADAAGSGGFAPFGAAGVFTGASVVFFAYVGFDGAAAAAEEAVNPGRDLPRAIVGSLAICTVLYVLMATCIVGMVPYYAIDGDAPYAEAFEYVGQTWAATVVAVGALAGITTSLLVSLMAQPRMWVAVARDGLVPQWFAELHPQYHTPANATLFTVCTSGVMALVFPIETLAELVSVGTLMVFMGVNLAVLHRRYSPPAGENRDRSQQVEMEGLLAAMVLCSFGVGLCLALDVHVVATLLLGFAWLSPVLLLTSKDQLSVPEGFKTPLVPAVPSLGVLCCATLIGSLRTVTIVAFLVWIAVALAFYFGYSKTHGKRARSKSENYESDDDDVDGAASASESDGEEAGEEDRLL